MATYTPELFAMMNKDNKNGSAFNIFAILPDMLANTLGIFIIVMVSVFISVLMSPPIETIKVVEVVKHVKGKTITKHVEGKTITKKGKTKTVVRYEEGKTITKHIEGKTLVKYRKPKTIIKEKIIDNRQHIALPSPGVEVKQGDRGAHWYIREDGAIFEMTGRNFKTFYQQGSASYDLSRIRRTAKPFNIDTFNSRGYQYHVFHLSHSKKAYKTSSELAEKLKYEGVGFSPIPLLNKTFVFSTSKGGGGGFSPRVQ